MALFLRECKNILKSYIYYVFIAVVVLFYISQMEMILPTDLNEFYAPPQKITLYEGEAPYGEKESEPSMAMISKAAMELYREYKDNLYVTYPIGVYKKVKLNDKNRKEVELVLEEITGKNIEELKELGSSMNSNTLPVNKEIKLERFQQLMISTDKLLGGGSAYGERYIGRFTRTPITYEEIMKEYDYMVNKDRLTNGYARLFSDYLGVIMGIFPIFVAVFMSIKDSTTNMRPLVYSRNTSSAKLIFSRYFALIFMMTLPIIALGVKETIIFILYANANLLSIDLFAFIKYSIWWIMPTIMIVTALGMLLTVLTDTPIAIAVGLFNWFLNINRIKLSGDYPLLGLFIRHNTYKKGIVVAENSSKIMANRLVITGISLLIVMITVFIYEKKRSGYLDLGRKMGELFSFNKSKYKTNNLS